MKNPSRFIVVCILLGVGETWTDFASVVFSAPPAKPAALRTKPAALGVKPSSQRIQLANEVLVKFKPTRSEQGRTSAVGARGHGIVKNLRQPGWVQVKIHTHETVEQALAAYQNHPDVEHAQPNYVYRTAAIPNDPHFAQLWGLKNIGQTIDGGGYFPNFGTPGADINIEKVWDHITDCSSVVVAVLDTGINYNHEDLASNMWNGGLAFPKHGADFVDNDDDPMDLHGHGTHVAAIIGAAGNNATGTTGVCWKASIMALRVLDAGGSGTTATVVQAVNFAVEHGAKVLNMSFGGGAFDQAFSDAIENARMNDVVIAAAAGNGGWDAGGTYPCAYAHANLVCVAAFDQNLKLATFSNFNYYGLGGWNVDVAAPGTNILSAVNGLRSTIGDEFNTSGVLNWTTSGGWAFRVLPEEIFFSPYKALVNPANLLEGWSEGRILPTYANNVDQRVYKNFDLGGKTNAVLNLVMWYDLIDPLKVNFRSGGGDPFAGGVLLDTLSGGWTEYFITPSYDISACAGGPCSIGFQLLTDAVDAGYGVAILGFSIDTFERSNTSYATFNGTSMSTPYIAGLAAMLRVYNPRFTYADVVNAITVYSGKRAEHPFYFNIGSNVVDFMSSLAYIAPPTGVRATVAR